MHLLYVVEGVMQPTLYEESGSSGAHTPSRLPTTACLRCREQEVSHLQFDHQMEMLAESKFSIAEVWP